MLFDEDELPSSMLSQEIVSGYNSPLFPYRDRSTDMDYNAEFYFEGSDNDGDHHALPSDNPTTSYETLLHGRGYATSVDHRASDISTLEERQDTFTEHDHWPQLHAFESIPRLPLENAIETVKHFSNFIHNNTRNIAIAGHLSTLEQLALATSSMARVQVVYSNDPYNAYLPLQIALRQLYFHMNIPKQCPSALDLCTLHRSSRNQFLLETVAYEAGTPVTSTSGCLDLNSMIALLRLIALRDWKKGEKEIFYQLGILTFDNGLYHARIYPMSISDATGTAWLYFGPKSLDGMSTDECFGLCSEEAFVVQDKQTGEVFSQQTTDVTPISTPLQSFDYRARPISIPPRESDPRSRSTSTKRKADAEATPSDGIRKKRKTASQIQKLHNEFHVSYTPTQILDERGDVLHYNNLLRVAVWFGNNDIFQRLNAIRLNQRKEPYTALSAITKRIGVACKYLAEEHDLDPRILRAALNAKRAENKISIRDTASSDLNISDEDDGKVSAALDKILSASAHSGLIKHREMEPISSRHNSLPPRTAIADTEGDVDLAAGDMMDHITQDYTHSDYADGNDQFEPYTSPIYNYGEPSMLYDNASTHKLNEQLYGAADSNGHIYTHSNVSQLPDTPVSYNNTPGSGRDQYIYQPQLLQPEISSRDNHSELVDTLMDDITQHDARSSHVVDRDCHEAEKQYTDLIWNDSNSSGDLTQLTSFEAEPSEFTNAQSSDYVLNLGPLSEAERFGAERDDFTAELFSNESLSDFAFGH